MGHIGLTPQSATLLGGYKAQGRTAVLVWHDLLGVSPDPVPRFVKRYAEVASEIRRALGAYANEVREGIYPEPRHTYPMPEEERARFEEMVKGR
jgi:3-methyl-2-oxobutanoate hydroxymethyltransferase